MYMYMKLIFSELYIDIKCKIKFTFPLYIPGSIFIAYSVSTVLYCFIIKYERILGKHTNIQREGFAIDNWKT